MRVLVTRPLQFSEGLCQGIQELNGIPEIFPVVEIRPTPHQKALKGAVKTLSSANIVIFISRSAVHYGMSVIQSVWKELPVLIWITQGPGTTEALSTYQIPFVVSPTAPPYESESLLELPELQDVKDKRIIIFRGNGGRAHLSTELRARGAFVQMVETYQRQLPILDMGGRLSFWQKNPLDVIIVTSSEGMNNFVALAGDTAFEWLRMIPIVVVSSRMLTQAKNLGFTQPVLAWSAEDAAIIQALKEIRDNIGENSYF